MHIFNFHSIEPKLRSRSRKNITMTQKGLSRFIRIIRALGFKTIQLKDAIEQGGIGDFHSNTNFISQGHPQGVPLPASILVGAPLVGALNSEDWYKCVALTFDDGYENFYRYAAPVLLDENCPATVFALAGKFSGTNDWDYGHLPIEERDRLMSIEQMKELGETGLVTFGSHGMEHRHLPLLNEEELNYEIIKSYEILSRELGSAFIPLFAYPWGEYSKAILRIMMSSPYRFAFTTKKGEWTAESSSYLVPRFTISYRERNPLFLLIKLYSEQLAPANLPPGVAAALLQQR